MTSEGELYVDETCRDEFKKYLDEEFGENSWELDGSNYSNYYDLTEIPTNISVPITDTYRRFIGRADIINSFEVEENDLGRFINVMPLKIQIFKFKENERICLQCSDRHEETLHNEKGCIVCGCGCRIINTNK